jgi:hypothetical protein
MKTDLKKQSQFVTDDIVATALEQIAYGDNSAGGVEENKANQNQFRTETQLNEPVEGEIAPALSSCVESTDRACQ